MSTDPSTATAASSAGHRSPTGAREAWATGLALFAGVTMLTLGVIAALAGISAIIHDKVYVAVPGYIYSFDLTAWGWIHLILGVLIAVAGGAVLMGQTWARIVGIALACLNLITNFLFLPYAPWWSLMIGALDVAVIWALATYRPQETQR